VDTGFWKERWESGQTGFHQDSVNIHLERFWQKAALARGAHLFVPLCGKSVDLLWLLEEGYRVTGVEVSPLAVEQFFEGNNLMARTEKVDGFIRYSVGDDLILWCGDYFELDRLRLGHIDGVYDRASLIALPPEMRGRYAAKLQELAPGATVFLVTLEYEQSQMPGPPFSVGHDEVTTLYSDSCHIEEVYSEEAIGENPRFAARGVDSLVERVYLLKKR